MKTPVSLSDDELVRLVTAARAGGRLRDWALILVTYWHGLRASEAVNLRVGDLADGFLSVSRGKGSEATLQPLMEHDNPLLNERQVIARWLAERAAYGKKGGRRRPRKSSPSKTQQSSQSVAFSRPESDIDDLVFPISRETFWRTFNAYGKAAGLPRGQRYRNKRKPHALKHTIAKHLIKGGVPLNEVQAWLGWKSIKTAAIYTVADDDEVAISVGKTIREKPAFRRELQAVLFADPLEPGKKPN
jgi:integrase